YSIGVFGIYLSARELSGTKIGGLIAAAIYGFSAASVIRSTGLEFSRENFALPFICFHLAFASMYIRRQSNFAAVGSALVLGAAQYVWDLTQIYIVFMTVAIIGYFLINGSIGKYRKILFCNIAVLVFAGLVSPYLRWHAFLSSYIMMSLYVTLILSILQPRIKFLAKKYYLAIIWIGLYVISCFISYYGSAYGDVYSNFISLLFGKLKYFNQIPLDPSKLNWDIRVLWTPALDSVSLKAFLNYFHAPIIVFVLGFTGMLLSGIRSRNSSFYLMIPMVLFFCFLCFFFRRMFVFFVIPFSVVAGFVPLIFRKNRFFRALIIAVVFFFIFFEGERCYARRKMWRRDVRYLELEDISIWARKSTPEDSVVLANFTLSPVINYYAGRSIVIHPKFEDPALREKVFEYGKAIFSGEESDFAAFCDKYGVNYFIFSRGTYSTLSPYSMRYIWNVKSEVPSSAAAKFERYGDAPYRFIPLYYNGKYRAYYFVSARQMGLINEYMAESDRLLQEGDKASAIKVLEKVLEIYPLYKEACFRLGRLYIENGRVREGLNLLKNAKEMLFE
ncbi:MAG: tetratricopeptide repeat protein, partial [Candidatus Auribacterota bacterium]|nr:tetratricopeptide repeat protein [Candidatus Auribacterota bacterium]